MEIDGEQQQQQQLSADPFAFARNYQLEALEKAIKENTIVFLETGTGKTLIAIMLLRSYAYILHKPSPFIAVFLVPQVVLVTQQGEAVKRHTDLNVGMYWGDMGVDYWDAATWNEEIDKHEVLVMTPAVLLAGLRHSFLKLNMIKLLIIDECHHARKCHPYACIMQEFYHQQFHHTPKSDLPRIFGMTASPIKSKGAKSEDAYWKEIQELESLLHSKVYTCVNAVLSQFVPFSTPKFKVYEDKISPYVLYANLVKGLKILEEKHAASLKELNLSKSTEESTTKRLSKMLSTLTFCLDELGIWLAFKAAQSLSYNEIEADLFEWGKLDAFGEAVVKKFSSDALQAITSCIPSGVGPHWSIGYDFKADINAGFLTAKVVCLLEKLTEYRVIMDIRCIIFVERVITALVIQSLLGEYLPKFTTWRIEYIAGNNSKLQCQTRKKQNEIVDEFRKGMVNIIVATSILEEGLDVQSCNLVIRFDEPKTINSFIQSGGRARKKNSDYTLMVESGDIATRNRLEKYMASSEIMKKESLQHASFPCEPLRSEFFDEKIYRVESTGAIVTLSSSIQLLYLYCSRLPSDGYFKPLPRCEIDKDTDNCTIYLPKSCPLKLVRAQGNKKFLKQIACLEACKQLHKIGALTDNLVPDVKEEATSEELGNASYNDEQPDYFPVELVDHIPKKLNSSYHFYLMELRQNFDYDIQVHDIVLATINELDLDIASMEYDLEVDRGIMKVKFKYVGEFHLEPEQVSWCMRFQITILTFLMNPKVGKVLDGSHPGNDYLLLPSKNSPEIDWRSIRSAMFSYENAWNNHGNCSCPMSYVHVKDGLVCTCMLQNSLVLTPHNGRVYCITGILEELNANSALSMRDGRVISYKEHYNKQHGIKLCFEQQSLAIGRQIFRVQDYSTRCRKQNSKRTSQAFVELPPELCSITMSPLAVSTLYSFSHVPLIMHRLESLLIAVNLRRLQVDHCTQNVPIPTFKVLEAITTKKCQEKFHLESLETLGDSFLKYAACQQLFKTYQNHHEGLLSIKKDKIISNTALCKLGCDRKIPGFIRNEPFDSKKWIIPGDKSRNYALKEDLISSTRKIFIVAQRKVKRKTVSDVVEALIGAFLSTGGEIAGLLCLDWLGVKVDLCHIPYESHFEVDPMKLVNVRHLESLLNYTFKNPHLLVEALTHGSYMLPHIPRCYQRLEFLGDAVLDYLITVYFYNKYPGMSPGLLTDMRSASVNNDCYALAAIKTGLHKHILHTSHDLHRDICVTLQNCEPLSENSTFLWESGVYFPKVLGDVIESIAGAILVDSGYNKLIVFDSIRPLLEPLITPETMRLHPVRELHELCQKENYELKKPIKTRNNGLASVTLEVEANGTIHQHTSTAADKKTAQKVASREVLKSLKLLS